MSSSTVTSSGRRSLLPERVAPDLGTVDAVGEGAERLPRGALGAALDDAAESAQVLHPVLVHEAQQALDAQRVGADQGVESPEHLVMLADVLR